MAVARVEPAYVRRYHSQDLRAKPVERRTRTPYRSVAIGVILAGGLAQHLLATAPSEPQPTPLAAALTTSAPASAAAPPAPAPAAKTTARHSAVAAFSHKVIVHVPAPPARAKAPARPAPAPVVRSHLSPLLPPIGAAGDAKRVAMAANPQGAIMHVPSVSVDTIRSALAAAGSPALGATYADGKDAAEYIWDAGRVLGVDPAVIMAIFHHESVFGTQGMARLTNSVGNIRPLAGQPSLDGYRLYRSWQEGIDDCYRLLRSYAQHGATTIPQAIPVWAPPSDNNDDSAYISSVLETMGNLYAASAKP
jgi:hypothetical protein